jgi:hypothetical protein
MEDKAKPMEEAFFPSALLYLPLTRGRWKLIVEKYVTSVS